MFGLFKKHPAAPDRAPREYFRACNVYCRPESDQAIVASVYNHGGLMAEMPGGVSIVSFSDAAAMNTAIRASLAACVYEPEFNYSRAKPSDWPAYQASGYKTIKRFEADFIRLLVKGANEKNFFYHVTSPEFGEFGLHLEITVNANTGDHGEAAQYIVQRYLACKAVGEGGS